MLASTGEEGASCAWPCMELHVGDGLPLVERLVRQVQEQREPDFMQQPPGLEFRVAFVLTVVPVSEALSWQSALLAHHSDRDTWYDVWGASEFSFFVQGLEASQSWRVTTALGASASPKLHYGVSSGDSGRECPSDRKATAATDVMGVLRGAPRAGAPEQWFCEIVSKAARPPECHTHPGRGIILCRGCRSWAVSAAAVEAKIWVAE